MLHISKSILGSKCIPSIAFRLCTQHCVSTVWKSGLHWLRVTQFRTGKHSWMQTVWKQKSAKHNLPNHRDRDCRKGKATPSSCWVLSFPFIFLVPALSLTGARSYMMDVCCVVSPKGESGLQLAGFPTGGDGKSVGRWVIVRIALPLHCCPCARVGWLRSGILDEYGEGIALKETNRVHRYSLYDRSKRRLESLAFFLF